MISANSSALSGAMTARALRLAVTGAFALPGLAMAAAGDPIGPEFAVASTAPANAADFGPTVVGNAAGQVLVAWERQYQLSQQDADNPSGIALRRFNADGVPAGPELNIVSVTAAEPRAAINASGRSVVVWRSRIDRNFVINAQRIGSDGSLQGAPVIVEPDFGPCSGIGSAPQVAIDDSGDFVVAWENCKDSSFILVGYTGIQISSVSTARTRRYNADGTPKGKSTLIASATIVGHIGAQAMSPPSLAITGSGSYVVGWLDRKLKPVQYFYDAAGHALNRGLRLTVSPLFAYVEEPVRLGLSSELNATVAYRATAVRDLRNTPIMVQRFSPSGSLGDPVVIEDAVGASTTEAPELATLPTGRSVAVWRRQGPRDPGGLTIPDNALRGRSINTLGVPEGVQFTVTTEASAAWPGVAYAAPDRYFVTWLRTSEDPVTHRNVLSIRGRVLSAQ